MLSGQGEHGLRLAGEGVLDEQEVDGRLPPGDRRQRRDHDEHGGERQPVGGHDPGDPAGGVAGHVDGTAGEQRADEGAPDEVAAQREEHHDAVGEAVAKEQVRSRVGGGRVLDAAQEARMHDQDHQRGKAANRLKLHGAMGSGGGRRGSPNLGVAHLCLLYHRGQGIGGALV
jgi:hypothetical protein